MTEQNRRVLPLLIGNKSAILGYIGIVMQRRNIVARLRRNQIVRQRTDQIIW
jgi:hypothetical protein